MKNSWQRKDKWTDLMWVGKQQERIQEERFKDKVKILAQDDHPVLEISVDGNVYGSIIQNILFIKPS